MSTDIQFPIPAEGQNPIEFFQKQAEQMAQEKLKAKLVEMHSKPKPSQVEKVGNMLYVMDTIYDVWPDDEDKGKSAKLIAEIFQLKIGDYSRIHDEFEYDRAEYQYFPGGIMRFVLQFKKK